MGPVGSSCPALVPFFVPILEMLIVLVDAVQSWMSCEVEQLVRGGSGHTVTTDVFLLGRTQGDSVLTKGTPPLGL